MVSKLGADAKGDPGDRGPRRQHHRPEARQGLRRQAQGARAGPRDRRLAAGRLGRPKAANIANDTLTANPDLVAIFAANDGMALGAVESVYAAGKGGEVAVIGVDGNSDAVKSIKAGRLNASVAQLPYLVGSQAVEKAKALLDGQRPWTLPTRCRPWCSPRKSSTRDRSEARICEVVRQALAPPAHRRRSVCSPGNPVSDHDTSRRPRHRRQRRRARLQEPCGSNRSASSWC